MRADISKLGLSFIVSMLMLSSVAFAQGLQDVINAAKDIGVFQFYLPFIITFAVLYGLMQKVNILGNKQLNIIVSLAIAAFVMVYTPVGITLSQFFTNLFGNAIVVVLTVLVVGIFASVIGTATGGKFTLDKLFEGRNIWVAILLFLLLGFGVFVASGGTSIFPGLKINARELFSPVTGLFGISSTTLALLILIVGTGIIVWFFFKDDKTPPAGGGKPA